MAEPDSGSADSPLAKISLLAHDLANQLVAVVSRLSLLVEGHLDPATAAELGGMLSRLRGARESVAEILQTARGDVRERVLLARAVERAAKLALGEPPSVTLETVLRPAPIEILANRGQIEQIVESALRAEREAFRRSDAKGRIRCEILRQGARARLVVDSEATPPPRDEAARLFHPLNVRNPPEWGAGLGFGVCAAIARTHGGSFALQPTFGGRRYELDLPLLLEAPAAEEQLQRAVPPKSGRPGAAHLLVVDDEAIVRNSYQMILSHLGYTSDIVSSAAEAYRLLGQTRYDGAIIDLRLGGTLEGRDIVDRIRRSHPHLLPRTVISTGDPSSPVVSELVDRLRVRILAKPFGLREVRELLA